MPARGRMKYYILNKETDYQRGFFQNMTCSGSGIWTSGTGMLSVFISRVFDSGETGCVWHRLRLEGLDASSVPMHLKFYSLDTRVIGIGENVRDISDVISLPEGKMTIHEKLEWFEPYLRMETDTSESLLLHQVQGRYMWFTATACCPMGEIAGFCNAAVYFPRQTWIEFLPEIYQGSDENGFLERYLSIFQTLYDDLDEKIRDIPSCLDTCSTDGETLKWIAGWLGIKHLSSWNEDQLRYLIGNAGDFYRKRGTREGICEFIKLYTGEEPFIAEQHFIEKYSDNESLYALLRNLYGNDPWVFTVLIRASCLPSGKEFSDLVRIIEEVKPAWMDFKIITLRPYILLDSYTYLGVNSVLGQYLPVELDGLSMLSFATVGKGQENRLEKERISQ